MVESSPTALRRWIGSELKRMREAAGIERAEVAERFMKTAAWPGHLETGRNLPSVGDLALLLDWYGHPERLEFFRTLLGRAKRGKDWWSAEVFAAAVPEWFTLYLGLESIAATADGYDAMAPAGLAQTEDTARAVIRTALPDLPEEEVERRVALRMARQGVLTDRTDAEPLRMWRVIDESALLRPFGGPKVQKAQLEHYLELAELDNVTFQVLPLSVGGHPSIEGPFTLLTYPPEYGDDPGTVYVEDRQRGTTYEEPHQIADFRRDLDVLRELALTPVDSLSFIHRLAKEITP